MVKDYIMTVVEICKAIWQSVIAINATMVKDYIMTVVESYKHIFLYTVESLSLLYLLFIS